MKTTILALLAISATLTLSGCSITSSADKGSKQAEQSFDASAVETIDIKTENCQINLRTGKSDQIQVQFFGDEKYQMTANTSGQQLNVAVETGNDTVSMTGNLHLDILVPESATDKTFTVHTERGGVQFKDLTAKSLIVDGNLGNVNGSNFKGDTLQIKVGAGGVDLNVINAKTQVTSGAGSITVAGISGELLDVHSSSGAINLQDINAELSAESSSGQIQAKIKEVTRDIDITSSAGGIDLWLPASGNFDLEANSMENSRHVEFALSNERETNTSLRGTVGSGGPRVKVSSSASELNVNKL